jgi:hypothetical protein
MSRRNPKKGDWSQSPNRNFEYSVDNLFKILTFAGLNVPFCGGGDSSYLTNPTNLKIVKGFFDQTTRNLPTEKIALLHLDGDLYNSVKIPLDNLASKISIGGIVVVDDFQVVDEKSGDEAFPGARTAINEFLISHDNFVMKESIRGTPVLVKMR